MTAIHASKQKLSAMNHTNKYKTLKEIKGGQTCIATSKNIESPKTQSIFCITIEYKSSCDTFLLIYCKNITIKNENANL